MSLSIPSTESIAARTKELFQQQHRSIIEHTDRLCANLMIFQWFFGVALAIWISPQKWEGVEHRIHPHVWAAVFLGALVTIVPVLLGWFNTGAVLTRHTIAVGQMLMSALLIHLTGGRIETHFHVFGSLAILAFYRDWTVLISATAAWFMWTTSCAAYSGPNRGVWSVGGRPFGCARWSTPAGSFSR